MERKTLGLLQVAAGALLYRSMCVKSSFKPLGGPDVSFAMKAGGNALSVLIATRGFEQLGCSEGASLGLVVGSVIAYEWLKYRDVSSVARGHFVGDGAPVLSPPKRPVTYTPTPMPQPVTYTPAYMPGTVPQTPPPYVTHDDFGPGF